MQGFFQNYNDVISALRLRITSDECKNVIPQWRSVRERIYGTTQRSCHKGKRIYGMSPEEIHLWTKARL
jgi:hypothetical protein